MALHEQLSEYRCGDTLHEGFFCYDDSFPGPQPVVLISHDWSGRGEFSEKKAHRLAYLGYAAFALDMYGKGKRGNNPEENQALMMPLMQDRALLAKRINAALAHVRTLPQVDAKRVAAMGFCFGGLIGRASSLPVTTLSSQTIPSHGMPKFCRRLDDLAASGLFNPRD